MMEIHRDNNLDVSQTINRSSISSVGSPPTPSLVTPSLVSVRSPLVQRDHNVIQKSPSSTAKKKGEIPMRKINGTPKTKSESRKEIGQSNNGNDILQEKQGVRSPASHVSTYSPLHPPQSNNAVDKEQRRKLFSPISTSNLDQKQTYLQRFIQEQRQSKEGKEKEEISSNRGTWDEGSTCTGAGTVDGKYDVLPSPNKQNKQTPQSFFIHHDDDEPLESEASAFTLPVLQLGNFQESLWLDYGDDRLNTVGKSHSLSFVLQAPSQNSCNGKVANIFDDDYHILEIEKVPTKKGFALTMANCDANQDEGTAKSLTDPFCIKEGEKKEMTLTWKPICAGGVRETIYLKMQRGRIRIIAHGKAREARKTRKRESKSKMDKIERNKARSVGSQCSSKPCISQNITKSGPQFSAASKKQSTSSNDQKSLKSWMIYDNKCAEKQCDAYTTWLNYMIKPHEDNTQGSDELHRQNNGNQLVDQPTLKTLLIQRRKVQASQRAITFYNGSEMKSIRNVLAQEISSKRLSMRSDHDVLANVKLKSQMISLFMSYSVPWLKLGLETVFGETITLDLVTKAIKKDLEVRKSLGISSTRLKKTPTMKTALKQFITGRVLFDERLLMKYTHGKCKMPSGKFERMYKEELRQVTLNRILVLVVFLDKAKTNNVIESSPRLFHKNAIIKSSKEFLAILCRDYLHGIGSVFKHLSQVGVSVTHEQTCIDELDFNISNLAIDLRDGVVLGKLAESLSGIHERSILSTMRLPAVSRLQKVHNVQIALSSFSLLDITDLESIHPNHIVDGHRHQVLKMLWSIICSFKLSSLIDVLRIRKEIHAVLRSNRFRCNHGMVNTHVKLEKVDRCDDVCDLLLCWCQAVCSCYGHEVKDFTTSFANGKTLCFLIHYYHPSILNLDELQTTLCDINKDIITQEEKQVFVENERKNSNLAKLKMVDIGGIPNMFPEADSCNIPDERSTITCVSYLCARLLESSLEIHAAIAIQKTFRECMRKRTQGKHKEVVSKIENFWLKYRSAYFAKQKLKFKASVDVIERFISSKKTYVQINQQLRESAEEKENLAEKRTLNENHAIDETTISDGRQTSINDSIEENFSLSTNKSGLSEDSMETSVSDECEKVNCIDITQENNNEEDDQSCIKELNKSVAKSLTKTMLIESKGEKSDIAEENISLSGESTKDSKSRELDEAEPDNVPKLVQMTSSGNLTSLTDIKDGIPGPTHGDSDSYCVSEKMEAKDESLGEESIDEMYLEKNEVDPEFPNTKNVQTVRKSKHLDGKNDLEKNIDRCQEPTNIKETTEEAMELQVFEPFSSATKQAMLEQKMLEQELAKIKILTEAKKREIEKEHQELIKMQELQEAKKRLVEAQAKDSIKRRVEEENATAAGLAKILEVQKAAKEAMKEKKIAEEELAKIKAIAKARKRELDREEQKLARLRANSDTTKRSSTDKPARGERERGLRKKEADELVKKVMIEATAKAMEVQRKGEERACVIKKKSQARNRDMNREKYDHYKINKETSKRVDESRPISYAEVKKTKSVQKRIESTQKYILEDREKAETNGYECTVNATNIKPSITSMSNKSGARMKHKSRQRVIERENRMHTKSHFSSQNRTLEEEEMQEQLAEIKALAEIQKEKMKLKAFELAKMQRRRQIIQTNRNEQEVRHDCTVVTFDRNDKEEYDKLGNGKRQILMNEVVSNTEKKDLFQEESRGYDAEVESVREVRISKAKPLLQARYRESRQGNIANYEATSYTNIRGMELHNKKDSSFSSSSTISSSPFKGKDPCSMSAMKLDAKTSEALHVLQTTRQLTEVMSAVITLENATRVSYQCCEAFASNDVPVIMYKFVRLCNRSMPHVELLQYILMTLCNVSKISSLIPGIITVDCVEILLDLLQMFRDKELIFSFAATLLRRIIFSDENMLVQCKRRENMKRIKGLYSISLQELDSNSRNDNSSSKHIKIGVRALKKLIVKLKN